VRHGFNQTPKLQVEYQLTIKHPWLYSSRTHLMSRYPNPSKGMSNNAYQFQVVSQHNKLQFPCNTFLMQLQGVHSNHPWLHNVNIVIRLQLSCKTQNLLQGKMGRNLDPTLLNRKKYPKVSIITK
jgi:hypothetical protein